MRNFSTKSVEPKRGQNPREVQQKLSNLSLFMILKFRVKKNNLLLAVILVFRGEQFIPLAKTTLKASTDKGFDGQSCFDSPDMGDVESPSQGKRRGIELLVASTLPR